MRLINWKIALICCSLTVVSCSSSDDPDVGPTATDQEFDGLRTFASKEEFSTAVKQALLNSLGSGESGVATEESDLVDSAPAVDAPTSPTAEAESDSSGGESESLNVTETNVQEAGVDESDRVKSDGQFLYVLNSEYGDVAVPEVAEDAPLNRTSVPYEPYGEAQIKVLSLDNESAQAQLLRTLEIETQQQRADGLYLHQTDSAQSLIVTASSMSSYWGYWESSYYFRGQKSSVYKINIEEPINAELGDSVLLDGQIISSRRIGDHLYVATRFFPWPVEQPTVDSQDLEQNIDAMPIEDLMPKMTRSSDGSEQVMADASNCFVAEKPERGYYSPDIVTLAVINLHTLELSDSVCYLGASETLYASTNAVFLATTQYNYGGGVGVTEPAVEVEPADPEEPDSGGSTGSSDSAEPAGPEPDATSPAYSPVVYTSIHQFNIQGGALSYAGSGKVAGHLGWDSLRKPYRMSERNGYLRVATHGEVQDGSRSPVSLSILKAVGNGKLDVVAQLPNENRPAHIGKPGEELYASRYRGDKAYLVTFRQIDPLYVIDLANPEDPYIAGELEIPGYSDYLQPVGENHLLGIGRGAIAANGLPGGDRGAFAQGVKISLFDVADPARPTEVQSIEIGKRGSSSNALYDPHGITVQHGRDGQPARLAIGINVNDIPTPYSSGPDGWYDWRETGLFGFEVNTSVNAGISQHGSIIVESRSAQQPYGPRYSDDRSVIVNDAVFYVHGDQVYGANWNSLGDFNGPY